MELITARDISALPATLATVIILSIAFGCSDSSSTQATKTPSSAKPSSPLSAVPHQAGDISNSYPMLKWQDYKSLASLIADLPAWTESGPTSQKEWERIERLAMVLQMLDPRDVQMVLVLYMSSLPQLPPITEDPDPRTKPVLLLRVMFEIPEIDVSLDNQLQDLKALNVHVAGGFIYKPLDKQTELVATLALPISWNESGPSLIAFRQWKGIGYTGPYDHMYQPHTEFAYFQTNFPYRQGLSELVDVKLDSWHDLIRIRELELNDK